MSERADDVYLSHILDAIRWIESYLRGVDEPTFKQTRLLQDGVVRQLEIIGEAVKRLSSEFRGRHGSVPWPQIAKMRDKLAHDYMGVDLEVVWDTARVDVPALKAEIERIRDRDVGEDGV